MSRRMWTLLLAFLTALLVAVPASAMAAPGGSGRGGGSGGGGGRPPGGGETTVANNLSVPAVFVGSVGLGLTTPTATDTLTALVAPTGTPSTGFEAPGYYYVQGVHKWQAQYMLKSSDAVTATWGDNLTGSAMKQVGHQIRVEVYLTSTTVTGDGYSVIKLNGTQADNVSPWGTKASDGTAAATPTAQTSGVSARVWVKDAYLTIDDGPQLAMPGEINASGAVTFGYNWRPTTAGTYTLTFHVPDGSGVSIGGGTTTTQMVTVTAGGTGGGGGPRR